MFEVGVGSGANLVTLRARWPQLRILGTDINERAVGLAAAALGKQSLELTDLRVGPAHDLSWLSDRSVDVALADATLMYLGPDLIEVALREMLRVSRRAVVLNEWHAFDRTGADPTSRWWYGHWVHDYEALLRRCGARTVSVERLPAGQWGPGGWHTYGAIVDATPG